MKSLEIKEHKPMQFESEEQMVQLASKGINDEDLEVVRSSLTLLNEIRLAAESVEDMQGELAKEITQTCILMRKQMSKTVEAKSMFSGMVSGATEEDTVMQITIYLELIDQIDQCLQEFKNRFVQLHQSRIDTLKSKVDDQQPVLTTEG